LDRGLEVAEDVCRGGALCPGDVLSDLKVNLFVIKNGLESSALRKWHEDV
jgi:hypothetical protein